MPSLRWKVGILTHSFESHTVFADTAEEAVKLVMSGQGGTPAESWGPLPVVAATAEMNTEESRNMHHDSKHWLVPNPDERSDETD